VAHFDVLAKHLAATTIKLSLLSEIQTRELPNTA